MSQAQQYLDCLFTEPALELNQMVHELKQSAPLHNLSHFYYCDNLLFEIEQELRQHFSTVVDVIEFIRMQWTESISFRDQYCSRSIHHFPPESFYDSADFYRDHLEDVQRGLLKSGSPKLKDVRQILSDFEFKQQIIEFAQYSEMLRAIERTYGADPHEFSATIGSLFEDAKLLNNISNCGNQQTRAKSIQHYKQKILHQLGGPKQVGNYKATGDYQLLMAITQKLDHLYQKNSQLALSEVTKYHHLKSVATGQFAVCNVPKDRWTPFRGTKQLRKCFPRFRSLFNQHLAPVPWKHLQMCSFVYCFVESTTPSIL